MLRMVRICILVCRILLEWFKFSFECFESLLNGQNWIQMLRIHFEWLKFGFVCLELEFDCFECLSNGTTAFECFESLLNCSNLHSNASNPFRVVRIVFESFKSLSNLHSNAFHAFRMVRNCIQMFPICVRMLSMPVEWLNFAFECFDPFRMARIWI